LITLDNIVIVKAKNGSILSVYNDFSQDYLIIQKSPNTPLEVHKLKKTHSLPQCVFQFGEKLVGFKDWQEILKKLDNYVERNGLFFIGYSSIEAFVIDES
jgi:hypothetical protein